jgi:hypothetical protein
MGIGLAWRHSRQMCAAASALLFLSLSELLTGTAALAFAAPILTVALREV